MGNPKTVLFAQHYPDGGSITGLLDLVRGLDPERYAPLVTFPTTNSFVPEFVAAGVEVVILDPDAPDPAQGRAPDDRPTLPRSSSLRREARRVWRRDLPSARRLRSVIRQHDVALVHANNDVSSNRDAILAAMWTRRPVVVHVRWLAEYRNDVKHRIDRFLAGRVQRFLFMSQAIASSSADLGISPDRELVLDDPFHIDDYAVAAPAGLADELGVPGGGRVVLHVGRIIPWKGQDVFLRAMAVVLEAVPDACAVLVGSPTDDAGRRFQLELEALAERLGISDRVVFAGSRRDVPQLIALSAVVVHCSTLAEPFGRVVVEAMAGGRPVIGADEGGVPEIIEAGVTGLLVRPGDPAVLGDAITGLLADPEAAEAMGARARQAVAARFSIETHARAVQAVYDDLLR